MRALLLALTFVVAVARSGWADQTTVFRQDFGGDTVPGPGTIVQGYEGTPSLLIQRPEAEGGAARQFPLPAGELAGQAVTVAAVVRAEGVSPKPRPHNGIKVMLVLEFEGGGRQYPQIDLPVGTFGWVHRELTLRVPARVTGVTLVARLEAVSGRLQCGPLGPSDSAFSYLRHCIELVEAQGWDRSYHACRERPGWSVEHGPDPNDRDATPEPTPPKELVPEWFAGNRHARGPGTPESPGRPAPPRGQPRPGPP